MLLLWWWCRGDCWAHLSVIMQDDAMLDEDSSTESTGSDANPSNFQRMKLWRKAMRAARKAAKRAVNDNLI